MVSGTGTRNTRNMLKLRSIGIQDYSVFENKRIGWIRFADEHMPGVWLWNVVVHLTGGLPMGSASDLDTAGRAGESVQRRFCLGVLYGLTKITHG